MEPLLWDTSIQGTLPSRGRKIWSQANILIISLSATSVEGTPLFRGKEQKIFWVPNPRFYLYLRETLILRTWLTPRRVDKKKSTLIAMIAAFTTCTISHLNEKWCTALLGTTVQQFVREKLTVIFYLAAQKMITAADFRTSINPLLVILLTIPCPTFIQKGTSIQETLSSVLWLHPHWKQALLFGWAKWAAWQRASEWFTRKGGFATICHKF